MPVRYSFSNNTRYDASRLKYGVSSMEFINYKPKTIRGRLMITVSSNALEKINDRIASHQVWGVRLLMKPGGCGGWEWELKYEDSPSAGDDIFYNKIAVDPMTLSFVEDINIDYTEDGLQEMFLITTPSATAECGCGESFTI